MGYERSQLLEDTRYDLIRENTNELSSACPPVKALGLIREEAPLTGNTSGIEASIEWPAISLTTPLYRPYGSQEPKVSS